MKINCTIHTIQSDCVQTSGCGWCGSTRSCILGNMSGPLQPCVKSSYIFSNPMPNWNPQVKTINEKMGGVSLHVVTNNWTF